MFNDVSMLLLLGAVLPANLPRPMAPVHGNQTVGIGPLKSRCAKRYREQGSARNGTAIALGSPKPGQTARIGGKKIENLTQQASWRHLESYCLSDDSRPGSWDFSSLLDASS